MDGGVYETLDGKFALVKPGGDKSKPYVYASDVQSGVTEHHSHHYELSEDMKTVKLVKESWRASEGFPGGVDAPAEATLSDADYQGVKERISAGRDDQY